MKISYFITLAFIAIHSAYASDSIDNFILGEPTNGVSFSKNEASLKVRVRVQGRIDFGDLEVDEDRGVYKSDSDLYIRRSRLELTGRFFSPLSYSLHLNSDNIEKNANDSNDVSVLYAYMNYKVSEHLNLRFGKSKLPLSRVEMMSSSKQLFVDRPFVSDAQKKIVDSNIQTNFQIYGSIGEGRVKYYASAFEGIEENQSILGSIVSNSSLGLIGRLEYSPSGWVENKKNASHQDESKHFCLGVNYGEQNEIEYKQLLLDVEEDRNVLGIDCTFLYKGFTFDIEYNQFEIEAPGVSKKSEGFYTQSSYYFTSHNLEPAVRYELFDQNTGVNKSEVSILTVGLNWYLMGHSFKIQSNYSMSKFDENAKGYLAFDDKANVFQLMAQLYF